MSDFTFSDDEPKQPRRKATPFGAGFGGAFGVLAALALVAFVLVAVWVVVGITSDQTKHRQELREREARGDQSRQLRLKYSR